MVALGWGWAAGVLRGVLLLWKDDWTPRETSLGQHEHPIRYRVAARGVASRCPLTRRAARGGCGAWSCVGPVICVRAAAGVIFLRFCALLVELREARTGLFCREVLAGVEEALPLAVERSIAFRRVYSLGPCTGPCRWRVGPWGVGVYGFKL